MSGWSRFHSFAYDDLLKRDESLEDSANLPDSVTLAEEVPGNLQAALDRFAQTALDLNAAARRNGGQTRSGASR